MEKRRLVSVRAEDKFCRKKGGLHTLLIHTTKPILVPTYIYYKRKMEGLFKTSLYTSGKNMLALFIDKKLMNLNRLYCVSVVVGMFLKELPN